MKEIEENLRNAPAMAKMDAFLNELADCRSGAKTFTLVIDDPLGLSTVQPAPHRASQLKIDRRLRKASDDIYYGLKRTSVLEGEMDQNGAANLNEDENESKKALLYRLVRDAKRVVILSGAGISTESGIPAFRSPDGMDNLWDKYDPEKATLSAISHEEAARVEYWEMHGQLYELVCERGVLPNAAHLLAVQLERLGKLEKVITQNIDGLYQIAGLKTSSLLELHGTLHTSRCSQCSLQHDRAESHKVWKNGTAVPKCKSCGSPLRFGTIAFQEAIPVDVLTAAQDAVRNCDLLIVMGTALVVQPANKLPEIAMDRRVPVALLNLGPTHLDTYVDLHIAGMCGPSARFVIDRLESGASLPSPILPSPVAFPPLGIDPPDIARSAAIYLLKRP